MNELEEEHWRRSTGDVEGLSRRGGAHKQDIWFTNIHKIARSIRYPGRNIGVSKEEYQKRILHDLSILS